MTETSPPRPTPELHLRSVPVASVVTVILCGVLLFGCAGESARIEVTTPSGGLLDCPDENVAYSAGGLPDPAAVGAESAQDALDQLGLSRPPGVARVEATTSTEVTFLFENEDADRLGRVVAGLDDRGWFVVVLEKCGTE